MQRWPSRNTARDASSLNSIVRCSGTVAPGPISARRTTAKSKSGSSCIWPTPFERGNDAPSDGGIEVTPRHFKTGLLANAARTGLLAGADVGAGAAVVVIGLHVDAALIAHGDGAAARLDLADGLK